MFQLTPVSPNDQWSNTNNISELFLAYLSSMRFTSLCSRPMHSISTEFWIFLYTSILKFYNFCQVWSPIAWEVDIHHQRYRNIFQHKWLFTLYHFKEFPPNKELRGLELIGKWIVWMFDLNYIIMITINYQICNRDYQPNWKHACDIVINW